MRLIIDIPDSDYTAVRCEALYYIGHDALARSITTAFQTAEPYEEGEWIKDEDHSITINMFKCSNCNGGGYPHFKYCPHCGSRMGGENDR